MIFGAHESIAGGMYKAFERGERATCDAIQVFDKSNNQWRARDLLAEELELWFEEMMRTGIEAVCAHTSYLINLASPDPALREKSYRSFREEVERCNVLCIPNLVFHPGAHVGSGEDSGMARIAAGLNRLFDELPDSDVTLCLETTAGTGSNLGSTFEELARIIGRVDNQAMVGVCLDTCHVFAAGYDIVSLDGYADTMRRFDDTVGLVGLKVVHVNDSKMPFGSHRDRHEHIGKGAIGLAGFRNVVGDPRLAEVPMILETHKDEDLEDDVRNLRVLRRLAGERA